MTSTEVAGVDTLDAALDAIETACAIGDWDEVAALSTRPLPTAVGDGSAASILALLDRTRQLHDRLAATHRRLGDELAALADTRHAAVAYLAAEVAPEAPRD